MRIVYIDIDTLRADHLGCYGYQRETSPNIDNIAKEGTIFTECYVSDSPCLPSRASLFTGRFGIHSGIIGHGGTAADLYLTGKDRDFVDSYLTNSWIFSMRKGKFYTTTISPFAERHSAYWFYAGWNEMHNTGKMGLETADDVFPRAKKWLDENGSRDNWLLHLNIWDPHTPYRTPLSFECPFENDPIPEWMTQEIIDEHRKSYGPHSAHEPHGFKNTPMSDIFVRVAGMSEIKDLDDYRNWINGYDAGVRYADEFVGKIVHILKELGVYEDTLIMISSDHGECQGELNVYGDHCTADHIVNRVPMIIKWPGKKWKKQYDSLIHTNDVAATMLEGFNKPIPRFWDGKSFFKEIESGEDFGREYLVISQNAWSCQRSVRFDNWTLIKTYHTGLKNFPEIMLFDYEKDFHMTKNLADERPEILSKGLQYLSRWHDEMMKSSVSGIDPLNTVLEEGGPSHTRGQLRSYLRYLKRTGREDMVKIIRDRNEPYLS